MIKPLTSLRFIFALFVFLRHIGFIFNNNPVLNKLNNYIFNEGYLGVSFFFILSGFILSLNYKTKIISQKITFKDFWIARIAKIFPMHWVALLIAVPLIVYFRFNLTLFYTFIAHFFLLQSFYPSYNLYFSYNLVSWSLSTEMFFYFIFPFIILYNHKFKSAPYVNLILLLLIPIGIYFTYGKINDSLFYGLFYINPLFRIVDFLIGILLFNLYNKYKNLLTTSKLIGTLAEVAAIVVFIAFFVFHPYILQGYRYSCYYWLPMSVIIFVFTYQAGFFSKILSNRLFVLAGKISFSFYLFHLLVIRYVIGINERLLLTNNAYILFSIIFLITVLASYFSYRYIEVPANTYIKNRYAPSLKKQ